MNSPPVVHVISDDLNVLKSVRTAAKSMQLRVDTDATAEVPLAAGLGDGNGCVVLDLGPSGDDGMGTFQSVYYKCNGCPIVVLSSNGGAPLAVKAMKLGAFDFLEKPLSEQQLRAAIRSAVGQQDAEPLAGRIANKSLRVSRSSSQGSFVKADPTASLTPRLRQTMDFLMLGDSEKQIAQRLGISRHTVHDYVKALHRHFKVRSRGELLARCFAARER